MRVTRLYCPQQLAEKEDLVLSPEHVHHVTNVLRQTAGDKVLVFNDRDGEFEATLVLAKKSNATVRIDKQVRSYHSPKFTIHLCLGVSRGDRMDYGIQKSVELGVSEITPLYSEFGEGKIKQPDRLKKKLQHWQRIAESASEQCGRLDVPLVNSPSDFSSCIRQGSQTPILVMDGNGSTSLSDVEVNASVKILIGPEGGFSQQELAKAAEMNCHTVSLGPRTLRTETAPVAALAILQHRFGDL